MKRLIGEHQGMACFRRQLAPHKGKITILVRAIQLVSNDRISPMGQMYPDLVFPSCPGDNAQKREIALPVREPS